MDPGFRRGDDLQGGVARAPPRFVSVAPTVTAPEMRAFCTSVPDGLAALTFCSGSSNARLKTAPAKHGADQAEAEQHRQPLIGLGNGQ